MHNNKPTRPLLRYHGGKWLLAPWIISHFPAHRIYVEPYGGSASVLFQKKRSYIEVYGDLHEDLVNLFRVLQDRGKYRCLRHALDFTLFSRSEFDLCYVTTSDPVERARRTVIRSWMGIGPSARYKTNFRTGNKKKGTQPARNWVDWVEHLDLLVERLRGVVIENDPAEKVIHRNDTHETLFYLDPTYLPETRSKTWKKAYRHEMSMNDHIDLADTLHSIKGMVLLSGYDSDLYNEDLYKDWIRITQKANAGGHSVGMSSRKEVLWLNPSAMAKQKTLSLF